MLRSEAALAAAAKEDVYDSAQSVVDPYGTGLYKGLYIGENGGTALVDREVSKHVC